ncbi:EF-P 5-aminopentanol modification-associated protein YfmF [uncultured Marinococcus sp.]|jgi:predicted Zn-dependent peptidase|uniref:EF-P 5-aminopentanol modification-associated protein YfmF n=1 Tax=uncultured Marinococcus sp. TaxID=487012 RepID=UPI00261A7927|nr:pitrilysin family protein [uncultured Marinococcus sp.]
MQPVTTNTNIPVHLFQTKQFKTTAVIMQCRAPLSEHTAAGRALLARVLKKGSLRYPSQSHIKEKLDDLYGASFSVDVGKRGNYHVMSFRMEFVNEQFLPAQEDLFAEATAFLAEMVHAPLAENRAFNPKIVEEEKRTLLQKINTIYDEKDRYANMRLVQEMCSAEAYSVHPLGDAHQMEALDEQKLYDVYEQFLAEDAIDVYVVGDVQSYDLEPVTGPFPERSSLPPVKDGAERPPRVRYVEESDDIHQGKLQLGYRTTITQDDPQFAAMQVTNGLFGGFPHSKLFQEVREKRSLAYYAASRYESQKGLVMVMTGIEKEQYEQVKEVIGDQLQALQQEPVSDELLAQTKGMLINQIRETTDAPGGLAALHFQGKMAGRVRPIETWIEEIEQVSADDVLACANSIVLDTVFFLHGKEDKDAEATV